MPDKSKTQNRITSLSRKISLRVKLSFAAILVMSVPLWVLASVSILQATKRAMDANNQGLFEAASRIQSSVDHFILTELNSIRSAAQLPVFVDYLNMPAEQRLGSSQQARAIYALDVLKRRNQSDISSYAVLDATGKDVLDTYTVDIGMDKSERDYFQEPIKNGLPYVSPIRLSQTVGDLHGLYFSNVIRDRNGNIIGVLRVRFNANVIKNQLNRALQGQLSTTYAVMVDNVYFIRLAHSSDPTLEFKSYQSMDAATVINLQQQALLPVGSPEELSTNQPDVVEGVKNADTTPFFTASTAAQGEEQAASAVIKLREAPWTIMVRKGMNSVMEPIQEPRRVTIVLTMLATVLAGILGVIIAQVETGPIVRLTETAKRIAGGDLNARAKPEAPDEIGDLATTLNTVADQLQANLQGLEQRVVERTQALNLSVEVGQRLATISSVGQLAAEVVQQIQTAFHYYHVHIYLFDENRQYLVMVGGSGEPGRIMLASGHRIPTGRGLVGKAGATGVIVLVADTFQDPNWLPNPLLPDTRAEVAVPIALGEQIFGVLDVQQNAVNGLNQQDADLLLTIADQVAVALRNALQFVQAEDQSKRQRQLSVIIEQIRRTTTLQDALQVAARQMGQAMNAERVQIKLGPGLEGDGKE